jgi:hypothetical protein
MREIHELIVSLTIDSFKGIVHALDREVGIQDQDPICGGIEQGIEALLLIRDLSVEACIEDRDGSLIGKGL